MITKKNNSICYHKDCQKNMIKKAKEDIVSKILVLNDKMLKYFEKN